MSVALGLLDPALADVRIEFGIARAEYAAQSANRATAELWAAIDDTLLEARDHSEVFVSTGDSEFAERAATADLAVRLTLSEATVRGIGADARVVRTRLPRLWSRFTEGDVPPSSARYAAELTRTLPDDPAQFDAFDVAIADAAVRLTPARFRVRARAVRDRIHAVALVERHRIAAAERGVWIDNDLDGVAWLTMRLPAEVAHRAFASIDGAARDLAGAHDEPRTLAQLRADVAGDLLTARSSGGGARVSVAVTVPVLTLLGSSDEPGTLEGYGPIDAVTARRLAAHAPSFTRLLTHPVSGSLLDIDRVTYRPPADLKRALEIVDVTCRFPGCGRAARGCDIDHSVDWQHGGTTRTGNLAHLCRHHHRLKHESGWRVEHGPGRSIVWTSPTGFRREADPPPF